MPCSCSFAAAFRAALAAVALATGCKSPRAEPASRVQRSVTVRSAELARPRVSAIETVEVPGDRSVLVVPGDRPRPIVYLHGMCSDARPDLEVWGAAVGAWGTVIALSGDVACPDRGGRTFAQDVNAVDARIDRAIEAASARRGAPLDPAEIILVGESLGAARGTALALRFPDKYTRLVLVGGPTTPTARELGGARAVALLAGEREPQENMRRGAADLARAGVPARFWELAGAAHGDFGERGAQTMSEAIAFVAER